MKNNIRNLLLVALTSSLLTACNKETKTSVDTDLSSDTSAELWIMTWSGDGKEHLDIGHKNLPTSEITALNVGMLQGIATEFNKIYPNIKINLFSTADDPSSGGTSWSEKLISFREAHNGRYPDVWASFNVIDDMNKGIAADLSVFSDDEDYQNLNPDLMSLMNYYGFQAGLPQYVIPWSIYVNKELAESKNILVPAVDWTWEEYTDFIGSAESYCKVGEICGAYDASMMIPRGAFIERQLQTTPKGSEYHVDFATDEFLLAIQELPKQSQASAMGVLSGIVDSDPAAKQYMDKGGYWGYNYFKDNLLLTFDGEPWMIFESNTQGSVNYVNSQNWDIYPRPAFLNEEGKTVIDNHVGVNLDPLVVYNYAADDNNPELSEAEFAKLKIAYTFAKFWVGDTRAWEAKAEAKYTSIDATTGNKVENYAINDTFPAVRQGEEFDKQMEIWYSTPNHAGYKDAQRFPGFAKVVELWAEGAIYGISDKAFPRYYHIEGDATDYDILEAVNKFGDPEFVGVDITDPTWYSTYSAFIKTYNKNINAHYDTAFADLKASMKEFYGWKDSDFTSN